MGHGAFAKHFQCSTCTRYQTGVVDLREHTAGVRNQQKVPEGSICTVGCIVIDLS